MDETARDIVADSINDLATEINDWAVDKGFWEAPESPDTDPTAQQWINKAEKAQKIALMHTELSEMLEGLRDDRVGTGMPGFSNEVEELADLIIRALDYAGRYGLPIGQAIITKMEINQGRPHRHGKAF